MPSGTVVDGYRVMLSLISPSQRSRPSASVFCTSIVLPFRAVSTSPGLTARPPGMFSVAGTRPTTLTGSLQRATATIAPITAVQDAISEEDNLRLVGRRFDVLVEGPSKAAAKRGQEGRVLQLTGRTPCDRIVVFRGDRRQIGREGAERVGRLTWKRSAEFFLAEIEKALAS